MMRFAFRKAASLIVVLFVVFSIIPSYAANEAKIIFTDVTDDVAYGAMQGEAKVLVSVEGVSGKVVNSQLTIGFTGNLKYKGIKYISVADNSVYKWATGASTVNTQGNKITVQLINLDKNDGYQLSASGTELFVLTFSGEAGDTVAPFLMDGDRVSYYQRTPDSSTVAFTSQTESATASDSDVTGKNATVKITLDKIGIAQKEGEYNDTYITLSIINETTGDTYQTVLNNSSLYSNEEGHRDTTETTTTFIVSTKVRADAMYTVKVEGTGYITKEISNVDFNSPVLLTNTDIVPGDADGDNDVDIDDKTACQNAIDDGEYHLKFDYNRDGVVNSYDMAAFSHIEDEESGDGATGDNNGGTTGGATEGGNTTGGTTGGNTGSDGGSGSGGGNGGGGGGGGAGGSSDADKTDKENTDNKEATTGKNEETVKVKTFSDMTGYDWAEEAIYTLKDLGIIKGVTETQYAPANNIKRGDFILILTRLLKIEGEIADNFSDVPKDSYYYEAIGNAKKAGIATGDGVSFMPEANISRQDLITLSYRAFLNAGYIEKAEELTSLDEFSDKDIISDYAKQAMASMVKAGIIKGNDGLVNPLGYATRAEVAVMCSRLLDIIK